MNVKLIVVGGESNDSEICLKLPSILGRGRDASITLSHPLVSRRHCEIFQRDGELKVRDLGSLNGTFIGNQSITEAVLQSGDLLTVGTVTFRAIYGTQRTDGSISLEESKHHRSASGSFDETEAYESAANKTTIQFETGEDDYNKSSPLKLDNEHSSNTEAGIASSRSNHNLGFAD